MEMIVDDSARRKRHFISASRRCPGVLLTEIDGIATCSTARQQLIEISERHHATSVQSSPIPTFARNSGGSQKAPSRDGRTNSSRFDIVSRLRRSGVRQSYAKPRQARFAGRFLMSAFARARCRRDHFVGEVRATAYGRRGVDAGDYRFKMTASRNACSIVTRRRCDQPVDMHHRYAASPRCGRSRRALRSYYQLEGRGRPPVAVP